MGMYSLPFFGVTGGGQTLPIVSLYDYLDSLSPDTSILPTLYDYLDTLNPPEVVPTLYDYLDSLSPDTSNLPSVFEYLASFTSIAIAPEVLNIPLSSDTTTDFTYTLTRSNPRNITTTVNYQVSGNNAFPTFSTDFVGDVFPAGFIVFNPEETVKTVTLTMKASSESGKRFILSVTAEDSDKGLVLTPEPVSGGNMTIEIFIQSLNTSLWLDAADASTLTVTNNAVSEWRDKTGNNRHANQETGNIQPVFVASDSSISFAGGKSLQIPGLSTATGNQNLFIVHSYAGNSSMIFWGSVTGSYSYVAQNGSSFAVSFDFGTPTYYRDDVLQNWNSRTAVYNSLLNRTSVVSAINCKLSGFNRIGGYANFNFVDKIYEIIVIPGTISVEDRNKLNGYLAWKWGLVANLPADHPYKNTAPL